WRRVLRFATSDGIQYYSGTLPSDCGEPGRMDDMDIKTNVAITHVSRLFNQIASPSLFEHVKLEGASRALKLFRRLSAAGPNGPRQWIKVIWDDDPRSTMAQMVTGILRLCIDLQGFFWFHPNRGAHFRNRKSHEKKMIAHIPGDIHIFRWNGAVECPTLGTFLRRASATLRVLVIMGSIICDCEVHMPIAFPSLTHLTIGGTTNFLKSLGPTLSLAELTLHGGDPNIISKILAPERTGTLRVLRFGNEMRVRASSNIFTGIHYYSHKGYPSLTPWTSDLNHPALRHLSVTGMGDDRYQTIQHARSWLYLPFRYISTTRFPMLDTIILDGVLFGDAEPTDTSRIMLQRTSDDFSSAEISEI
ncbi:hypothetical protein BD410DRAFT_795341, partial [Rickenella mellea]